MPQLSALPDIWSARICWYAMPATATSPPMVWLPTPIRQRINCWEVDVKGLTQAANTTFHSENQLVPAPCRLAQSLQELLFAQCFQCKLYRSPGQSGYSFQFSYLELLLRHWFKAIQYLYRRFREALQISEFFLIDCDIFQCRCKDLQEIHYQSLVLILSRVGLVFTIRALLQQ